MQSDDICWFKIDHLFNYHYHFEQNLNMDARRTIKNDSLVLAFETGFL